MENLPNITSQAKKLVTSLGLIFLVLTLNELGKAFMSKRVDFFFTPGIDLHYSRDVCKTSLVKNFRNTLFTFSRTIDDIFYSADYFPNGRLSRNSSIRFSSIIVSFDPRYNRSD